MSKSSLIVLVAVAGLLATPVVGEADTIDVMAQGISFDPADITVHPGDTIRWINGSPAEFHTVTTGVNCAYDSGFFNAVLSSATPEFEWNVPEMKGVIDYFCAPHCAFGMTGTITVVPEGCLGDANGDGVVDVQDLLGMLAAWGSDDPAYDIAGGNQNVDVEDLLALLGAWGDC